jgi:hypothetical protein
VRFRRWLHSWLPARTDREALLTFLVRAKSSDSSRRAGSDGHPKAAFDVISVRHASDLKDLTRADLILDGAMLARHYATLPNSLGAIDPRWGSRFSQSVAKRMARRLARKAAYRWRLDERLIANAWFFTVWTELCFLIPARRLARHLARIAHGELIIVPIRSTDLRYLSLWDDNDLEPFFLAWELRRVGAPALLCLVSPSGAAVEEKLSETLTFNFRAHEIWRPSAATAELSEARGPVALAPAAMRGYERLLCEQPRGLKVGSAYAPELCDVTLLSADAAPPEIALDCHARYLRGASERIAVFSPRTNALRLDEFFVERLAVTTEFAASRALELVDRYQLVEAHVCDHLLFESAIIADVVRVSGGKVFLWPHSSNACHTLMYEKGEVAAICCTTNSAARAWSNRLPHTPCRVRSDLILQPCNAPRSSTIGAPITIVVFAGAHALRRMPLVERRGHEESYRRLFRLLADLRPPVRTLFKAKTTWEPIEWLKGVLGASVPIEETSQTAFELAEPNMIYVTVSYGSTALLEGLSRGIPCMIVREVPVEDYTDIDPGFAPIGTVEEIVAHIKRCTDPAEYDALARRELAWYARETNFDLSSKGEAREYRQVDVHNSGGAV